MRIATYPSPIDLLHGFSTSYFRKQPTPALSAGSILFGFGLGRALAILLVLLLLRGFRFVFFLLLLGFALALGLALVLLGRLVSR